MGRTGYIGFFVDWLIESLATFACSLIFTSSASLAVGVSFYINAMVEDMKIVVNFNDEPNKADRITYQMDSWFTYVQEIGLHIKMIEYAD